MNFNQILTKSDKILTIYVKNHQIHVNKIQECNFLKIQKIQRQKSPRQKIQRQKSPRIVGIGVLGYLGGEIN